MGKPLFIGEVGIIEQTECNNTSGDPQAKANWVLEAASQTKAWNDDPAEADVIALCWSHVIVNFLDRHKLNYHVDTTPQAWAAFIQDTNDPYFRRRGVPLP